VKAPVAEGQSVLVQVSYDRNWRAYSSGLPVPIKNTKLGFILLDVPPGDHEIRLEFPTPVANRIGRAVTVLAVLGVAVLIYEGVRRRRLRT